MVEYYLDKYEERFILELDVDPIARICALCYALLTKNSQLFQDLVAFYNSKGWD
jgi:hypothetical protein